MVHPSTLISRYTRLVHAREFLALAMGNGSKIGEERSVSASMTDIPQLVKLLRDGEDGEKERAAAALWRLAAGDDADSDDGRDGDEGSDSSSDSSSDTDDSDDAESDGDDDNLAKIAAAGAIPPLVALLRDGNDKQKENAAGALWKLGRDDDNAIVAADGIPPLLEAIQ